MTLDFGREILFNLKTNQKWDYTEIGHYDKDGENLRQI